MPGTVRYGPLWSTVIHR